MSIISRLIQLYAPFNCLGCDAEHDRLLCESCIETVPRVPSRCYRCHATTRGYEVCAACRRRTPLRRVAVWGHHDGLPKALIWQSKYERAAAGLGEVAACMSDLLRYFGARIVLVPVPTASSRVRTRGYDQASRIAKQLARTHKIPLLNALIRVGQAHQVGASRAERIAHLQNAFRIRNLGSIENAHIVLVDDVCTTGATIESAARVLRAAGAKQVDAVVFSQPK